MNQNRRYLAVAAAAILMIACIGSTVMVQDEDNEVEAVFGVDDVIIIGLIVLTAVETGWIIGDLIVNHSGDDDGQDDDTVRENEANTVAESIINNITNYHTAMSGYNQIWRLTNDHFIRQAELAASEFWGEDVEFDSTLILEAASIYINSAYMLDNAASQINAMFDLVSSSLGMWNDTEVYAGKMTVELNWGSGSMSTKDSLKISVGAASTDVKDGHGKVFLTDESTIWASAATTISSDEGTELSLEEGYTDLADLAGFEDGVYTLGSGVSYCGDILGVIDAEAAPLHAGMVMGCGNTTELAIYDDGSIIIDGSRGTSVNLTIHPEGAESKTTDLTQILEDYSALMETINWTMTNAVSAAGTVWNIFDKAGQASVYLSTLMVPNDYEDMQLTQAQQVLITILAMEQLASYWDESSESLKEGEYVMSDSLALFVRGDIVDSTGEVLYDDVIFTPFYRQDTALTVGSNTVQREATIAIWGGGENLSSWDGITDTSKAKLESIDSGYKLVIAEMENKGQMVNSVDLSVNDIGIIDPGQLVHTPNKDGTDNDLDRIIMLVLVLFGILAIMSGWRSGSYIVMGLGAVMIVLGLLFSGSIENLLEDWFGWRIELG